MAAAAPLQPGFKLTERQRLANKLLGGPETDILLVGGSRAGKSFVLIRAIVARALKAAGSRHAIARFRWNHVVNSIGRDTLPSVLDKCYPQIAPLVGWDRSNWIVKFPNGSEIYLLGLDDKTRTERILGLEFATIMANEISQISYGAITMAKTRLAQKTILQPKFYYDCNPPSTQSWPYQLFIKKIDPTTRVPLAFPQDYTHMFMNPVHNLENVSEGYLKTLEGLPEAQRRRFLLGEFLDDVGGALWTVDSFKHLPQGFTLPAMRRVVVAVDPSGASGKEDYRSDEIGIVVVGHGRDGNFYVLADLSMRAAPHVWAATVVSAFHRYQANSVVAEVNFGGALVTNTLRVADRRVPVKEVRAARGKEVRAEPVANLYDQGTVYHVARFPDLEDQMLAMSAAGWTGSRSPDRLDALVWGLTDVAINKNHAAILGGGV
ncbi:MAG: phage terminase large subunit [Hyphomicrobium sp.]|nr:phage terminase large subunit [Hyphomicrobium sp.]